jgi:hypothetical protein
VASPLATVSKSRVVAVVVRGTAGVAVNAVTVGTVTVDAATAAAAERIAVEIFMVMVTSTMVLLMYELYFEVSVLVHSDCDVDVCRLSSSNWQLAVVNKQRGTVSYFFVVVAAAVNVVCRRRYLVRSKRSTKKNL